MNNLTIKTKTQEYYLRLDFNRPVIEVFEKIGIEVATHESLVAHLYQQIINSQLSFNENGIKDNEIIEIKEGYEGKL